MRLNTVEDFFNKRNLSVEEALKPKYEELDWEYPDVLYSFLGVYTLGLLVYYPKKYKNTGFQIRYLKNNVSCNAYSYNHVENTFNKNNKLNSNPFLLEFLEKYYELGNLMPIWPGGNSHRGNSQCFDLPDIYLKRHKVWTNFLEQTYTNANLDKIITSEYKDIENLLKLLDSSQNSEEVAINQYNELLKHIILTIQNRTKLLNTIIK